jgi:Holliday junction DNA helicase RuvA
VIASIEGPVIALTPGGAVVRVGGVGLAVQTTATTRAGLRVGEPSLLATSLVVREDSLTLYGFADDAERDLFELLQTASGVGPRLAQAVLTVHTPDAVRRALATEDLAALCLVPGIGRKGAQRLVLELKDKAQLAGTSVGPSGSPGGGWRDTLGSALVGLGWTSSQSDEVVATLAAAHPSATADDVPSLLREALAHMGRNR